MGWDEFDFERKAQILEELGSEQVGRDAAYIKNTNKSPGTKSIWEMMDEGAGKSYKVLDKNKKNIGNAVPSNLLSQYISNDIWKQSKYFGYSTGIGTNGELKSDSGTGFVKNIAISVESNGDGTYNLKQGFPSATNSKKFKTLIKSNLTKEEATASILAAYDVGVLSEIWNGPASDLLAQLTDEDVEQTYTEVDSVEGMDVNGIVDSITNSIVTPLNAHAKTMSWLYDFTHSEHYEPDGNIEMIVDGSVDSSLVSISPAIYFQKKPAGEYTFDTYTIAKNSTNTSRSSITRTTIKAEEPFLFGRFVTNLNPNNYNATATNNGFHNVMVGFKDDVQNFKRCVKTVNFSGKDYPSYEEAIEEYRSQLQPTSDSDYTNYSTHIVEHSEGGVHTGNRYVVDIFGYDPNLYETYTNGQSIQDAFDNNRHSDGSTVNEYLPVFNEQFNYIGPGVFFNAGIYRNSLTTLYQMLAEYNSEEEVPSGDNGIYGSLLDLIAGLTTNIFSQFVDNMSKTFSEWIQALSSVGITPAYYNADDGLQAKDDRNDSSTPAPYYIPSPVIVTPQDPLTYPNNDPDLDQNKNPQTHNPLYPDSPLDPRIQKDKNSLPTPEQQQNQEEEFERQQDNGTDDPTQPEPPNEGIIPPIVLPSSTATALFKVHKPTNSELDDFGSYLWSSNFIDNLLKMFSDPMQAIISLHQLYATPTTGGRSNIKCGYLDTGVAADDVTKQFTTINCGTIKVPKFYNNVMDNAPYTDLQLYLPFVGFVPLSNAECMGGSITVTYNIDVYSGQCVAHVKVERDGLTAVLYQYGGNCSVPLPYSGGNWSSFIQAGIGIVASGIATVATGGAAAPLLAAGAASIVGSDAKISRGGSFGQSIGALSYKKPYLIIDRRKAHGSKYQPYGYGDNSYVKLSKCRGYVRIKEVNLSGIQATGEELREIEQLLKEGIII